MARESIYVAQFGTGSKINLLPLAAGLLHSRLRRDPYIADRFNLPEIIFERPDDPQVFASQLEDVSVIGFSCFLWNVNASMVAARAVRERFPNAWIVVGGPSAPQEPIESVEFLGRHPYIDAICCGEGEDTLASLCRCRHEGGELANVPGLVARDRTSDKIVRTQEGPLPKLEGQASPYLDGTFDTLYAKYEDAFSGVILETNRGCPFKCSFCSWGNTVHSNIRERPLDQIEAEIDWIGRHNIRYVALSDSNFGIRPRDIAIAEHFARTKDIYGYPHFVSMSWAKKSSATVLKIADILRAAGIGFKVTLALQSLNKDALKAANRINFKREFYEDIRQAYHEAFLYSYIELLLGMPLETYESYMEGLEEVLSDSVFDQIYSYPLLLFPNAGIASKASREEYGIIAKQMQGKYTKSKVCSVIPENMEIIVGTRTMPEADWVNAFVNGYSTIGLHDDRLAFFIFWYLKRQYGVRTTDLVVWLREESNRHPEMYPHTDRIFKLMADVAKNVQATGASHLVELAEYGGVPYDPPDVVFLKLLLHKDEFYAELYGMVQAFLGARQISYDEPALKDLFQFQSEVIACPTNCEERRKVTFNYDWPQYFSSAFNLTPVEDLTRHEANYILRDKTPCCGDGEKYLKVHFQIRGVPALNELYDQDGRRVFPPVDIPGNE